MKNLRKPSQSGVAIVEFALVLPLLVLMSMVAVEFGRAMYTYNALAKSVRDASRYLSFQLPNTHMAEARSLVLRGTTTGDGPALVEGLTDAHVPDPVWQPVAGSNPPITTVTVQVTGYTFQSMFTQVFGYTFGPMTFSDIRATMRSHTS